MFGGRSCLVHGSGLRTGAERAPTEPVSIKRSVSLEKVERESVESGYEPERLDLEGRGSVLRHGLQKGHRDAHSVHIDESFQLKAAGANLIVCKPRSGAEI